MQLKAKIHWTVEMDAAELRLVLAALNRTLTEEQVEPAIELQRRLADTREKEVKNAVDAAVAYNRRANPDGPPPEPVAVVGVAAPLSALEVEIERRAIAKNRAEAGVVEPPNPNPAPRQSRRPEGART